jgi:hypothetical protein
VRKVSTSAHRYGLAFVSVAGTVSRLAFLLSSAKEKAFTEIMHVRSNSGICKTPE